MFRLALATLFLLPIAQVRADQLNVAAAISLKDALLAIEPECERLTGDEIQFTFGASGQLATQVQSGAPIDLFISASDKQIQQLIDAGRARQDGVQLIAGNQLVLVAPAQAKDSPASFAALADLKEGRIAVGEPTSVPAGEYASQVFSSLMLTDVLKGKLVFGANVRQVLTYVERGEVSAGIVYATDALQSGNKIRLIATADPAWHRPIVYPAVVIEKTGHREAAQRFMDFIRGDVARAALVSRGFTLPSPPATRPTTTQPARSDK